MKLIIDFELLIALCRRELKEALQQTATSEVLQVISSSPGDLEPVFETMLGNATRVCEAKFGMLWLAERDGFRPVALHNVPSALADERLLVPIGSKSLPRLATRLRKFESFCRYLGDSRDCCA